MQERPPPEPVDPPMVPFAVGGMVIWALLGVGLYATGNTGWAQICLAGMLWGIPGLLIMIKHDAGRARRARGLTPG